MKRDWFSEKNKKSLLIKNASVMGVGRGGQGPLEFEIFSNKRLFSSF